MAFPWPSFGLHMDDDTVCIVVSLHLGSSPLCNLHPCEGEVDEHGTHYLSCLKSEGLHLCHIAINDVVHRAFVLCLSLSFTGWMGKNLMRYR